LSVDKNMDKYNARVAFALMCGLAVACSVMYITTEESAVEDHVLLKSSYAHGLSGPSSVHSTDVQKAQTIFTNTPDGRMRLVDYFQRVEKEIAAELRRASAMSWLSEHRWPATSPSTRRLARNFALPC